MRLADLITSTLRFLALVVIVYIFRKHFDSNAYFNKSPLILLYKVHRDDTCAKTPFPVHLLTELSHTLPGLSLLVWCKQHLVSFYDFPAMMYKWSIFGCLLDILLLKTNCFLVSRRTYELPWLLHNSQVTRQTARGRKWRNRAMQEACLEQWKSKYSLC